MLGWAVCMSASTNCNVVVPCLRPSAGMPYKRSARRPWSGCYDRHEWPLALALLRSNGCIVGNEQLAYWAATQLVHACTCMTRVCPSAESPSARNCIRAHQIHRFFFLRVPPCFCVVAVACKAASFSCCVCSTSTALSKIVATRESNSFSLSFFGRVN